MKIKVAADLRRRLSELAAGRFKNRITGRFCLFLQNII